jgi:protein-S-isoprenylcysteine O-methyltransferase Ste14
MISLAGCWIGYFLLHSLFASNRSKKWVASRWPGFPYRLAYNLFAVMMLLPGLWLLFGKSWPSLWSLEGFWKYLAWMAQLLAISGFLVSLGHYDMKAFLGLKRDESGSFEISPFHRYVRHPWYFFALILIWSQDMNEGRLVFSVLATLYLFLGSMHEEKMLVERFGVRYETYRKKVPGLFPLPWKHLGKEEAETLVK